MSDRGNLSDYSAAVSDFHRARNQAQLQELLARLTGTSRRLLSYDEVRQLLRLSTGGIERGVKDIPLAAIIGSVGRYTDFTRDFLPLHESIADRWARVKVLASGMVGLPPIDVYQIGNVYFVRDGNHRVSVARQLGATHIQAYVTEVHTHAPLNPDVQPDDLIRLAEYNHFLEQTHLDVMRPEADLSVSIPGQYPILLNHIEVHRYYLGLDWQRDIAWEEAVTHWYDEVYLPVVQMIRDLGILRRFPHRTETDLYLWVSEHRAQLEAMLGGPVHPVSAASSLALEQGERYDGLVARLGGTLRDLIVPEKLASGPPPGQWRSHVLLGHEHERMFLDLLVPVNGKEDGWCALEQSFVVARRETTNLYGLHVTDLPPESDEVLAVRTEFESRCQREGVTGTLVVTGGEIVDEMCKRAALTDLVVVNLSHPPAAEPLRRLASGFRDLIRRCPSPILATPQTVSQLQRPLVAFDASPKAQEALFIAAYVAGKWNLPLTVFTVGVSDSAVEMIQAAARDYLEEHGVQAEYKVSGGPTAAAILQAVAEGEHDCILMGGYGRPAVVELALNSTVNDLLRECEVPVLICR